MSTRWMSAVVLAALVTTTLPSEARSQAVPFQYHQHTKSFFVSLLNYSHAGLVHHINIFFQVNAEGVDAGGGPPETFLGVGYAVYPPDSFDPIFLGEYVGPIDRDDFQVRGMNGASLEVTVPITDLLTGEPAGDATVIVDLAGVGETFREQVTTVEHFDGFLLKLHGIRETRTMVPSGSFSFAGDTIPLTDAVSELTTIKNQILSVSWP